MANSVYARRYAQAVFRMAQENQELNRWQSDLRKIASMCRDEALFALLENREVSFEEKERVLSQRLGEIHPMALKLVSMLVAKGRLAMVDYISDEYQQLMDGYRGIEGTGVAEVITAIPLDDEDRLRIGKRITDMVGRPVVLKPKVDPGVIGGIVIRVGDKLIDGSIRSKLAALRKELGGAGR
jgi:F-type H+-transporting ATPase subunit delta